jgi:hypothetical protein
VGRGDDVLFRGDEFFGEFFSGPEPGEDDVDVSAGFFAGEAHQFLGHAGNFHRGAHFQEENLAPPAQPSRLEDQVGRFGDGHEIAGHFGVGHGNGAAFFQLAAEQGQHRTGGADDVAEAHRHEADPVCGHGLQDKLGQAFAGSHDAGGAHSLIRGHQHEALGPIFEGQFHDHLAAQDIVGDGFPGVLFQQGHMFVGRGVENQPGPIAAEHPVQQAPVLYPAEDAAIAGKTQLVLQFHLNAVQIGLGGVH